MPLAAFGGRAEIMNFLAPLGPVYQAGTLAGNPAAVSAAIWMLKEIKKTKPHAALHQRCAKFYSGLHQFIRAKRLPENCIEEIRQVIARHNAELLSVEHPTTTLEELFLNIVRDSEARPGRRAVHDEPMGLPSTN